MAISESTVPSEIRGLQKEVLLASFFFFPSPGDSKLLNLAVVTVSGTEEQD